MCTVDAGVGDGDMRSSPQTLPRSLQDIFLTLVVWLDSATNQYLPICTPIREIINHFPPKFAEGRQSRQHTTPPTPCHLVRQEAAGADPSVGLSSWL